MLDELQKADPLVAIAEEFVLVGRVCVMLRGLGFVLRQPRSTALAWLPVAKQCLVEAGEWDPEDDARVGRGLARRWAQEAIDHRAEGSLAEAAEAEAAAAAAAAAAAVAEAALAREAKESGAAALQVLEP